MGFVGFALVLLLLRIILILFNMKAKVNLNIRKTSRFSVSVIKGVRNALTMLIVCCCMNMMAQDGNKSIQIAVSPSAKLLFGKWILEYSKLNPSIKFVVSDKTRSENNYDIKVITSPLQKDELSKDQLIDKVAKQVYLPVINENNPFFRKELKKGLTSKELKIIFLKSGDELLDIEESKKEPTYTVYTRTPQTGTAKIISNFFGQPANQLKGVFIAGEEKHLISAISSDSTGITFSNLIYAYNLENKQVVKGIKILPVDLNGNGKIDKEEDFGNLASIALFLESTSEISVPTDYVSLISDLNNSRPEVKEFIEWIKVNGQKFNSEYGFLSVYNKDLSQKL
jgi:phosphate transport system substrate-binding protein